MVDLVIGGVGDYAFIQITSFWTLCVVRFCAFVRTNTFWTLCVAVFPTWITAGCGTLTKVEGGRERRLL